MKLRLSWLVLIATLAASGTAQGGGSFERIIGVGANGASAVVKLDATGPRSDTALRGDTVPALRAGYVRVYPFIGDLPAIPGRLYPGANVLCLYWHEPVSNCVRLSAAGARLVAPLASLPLRRDSPTVPVQVKYRSHVLRYADGNVFAAIELALERTSSAVRSTPPDAIVLAVTWRGPTATTRPLTIRLTPKGVYARGRLSPLPRGVWCYVAINLPTRVTPASLIEATASQRCG